MQDASPLTCGNAVCKAPLSTSLLARLDDKRSLICPACNARLFTREGANALSARERDEGIALILVERGGKRAELSDADVAGLVGRPAKPAAAGGEPNLDKLLSMVELPGESPSRPKSRVPLVALLVVVALALAALAYWRLRG
ncbi:MAG: hypothetical protein U0271_46865 [Polyangiaceae bacterium]